MPPPPPLDLMTFLLSYTCPAFPFFTPVSPEWTWTLWSCPGGEMPDLWPTNAEVARGPWCDWWEWLSFFLSLTREERRKDRVWNVWGHDEELEPAVTLGHVKCKQVKEEAKKEEEEEEAELQNSRGNSQAISMNEKWRAATLISNIFLETNVSSFEVLCFLFRHAVRSQFLQ